MHGVDEAGDEYVGLDVGFGEETLDEMGGAVAFEVARRQSQGIKEGAALLAAGEKALAEESVERRHHGGVGQLGLQPLGHLLDRGGAELAKHGQHLALASAKGAERRRDVLFSLGVRRWVLSVHAKDAECFSMIDRNPGRVEHTGRKATYYLW